MVKVASVPASASTRYATGLGLSSLIGPVEPFLAEYWNRKPWHHRDPRRPNRFDSLLNLAMLDAILAEKNLREPYLRAAGEGRPLHEKRYLKPLSVQGTALRGVADVDKIAAEFTSGATILLDSIDHYHMPIKHLCDRLHAELRAPAEAVGFITPRSVQGLTVHYDNTEVFVLQTHGTKRWTVYPQIRPLPEFGRVLRPEQAGEPVLEVTLQPGDCLYVPWGSPHFAVAEGETACHISVMVRPPTWGAIISEFVDGIYAGAPFEPVPLAVEADSQALADEATRRLAAARELILAQDMTRFGEAQIRAQEPQPAARAGFLQQAAKRLALTTESVVVRNEAVAFSLGQSPEGHVLLSVDGRTYRYPAVARPLLEAMHTFRSGRVADLGPLLKPELALKVADHLVDNGVLTVD